MKINRLFLWTILPAVLSIASCKDDDDNTNTQPIEISSDITTARTLTDVVDEPGACDYIVTTKVKVLAALTVEPGVIVCFEEDADLSVEDDGSLNAEGTGSMPITFKGEQATRGYWGGLYFKNDDVANYLHYCNISDAGGDDRTIPAKKGALIVYEGGRLKLEHSNVTNSGGYGLLLVDETSNFENSGDNNFETCVTPVGAPLHCFKYFDAGSDFTGNDNNYIDGIVPIGPDVTGTNNWAALNVPYRLPSEISEVSGDIVIAAGTDIIADENAGLRIRTGGSLNANGTATDSITFKAQQATKGYWAGLRFESNDAQNILNYVVVAFGGDGDSGFQVPIIKSNIDVTGTLTLSNSIIRDSDGFGIYVHTSGTFTESNNTYSGNVDGDVEFE
ncbi:MAG: hypothetical protein SFW35_11440 [Chitinophagales bacterium]|nr:hypothetical protein [Chitinophagales bacterium]